MIVWVYSRTTTVTMQYQGGGKRREQNFAGTTVATKDSLLTVTDT
ncbi:MAG: hypothetical protein ACI90V_000731 [Bacillariaceae sp.]|jgi:hypothetical protein